MNKRFALLPLLALCFAFACAPPLVAAQDEEPVGYDLVPREGRVVIESTLGEVIPWTCFSQGIDMSVENWFKHYPSALQAGIRVHQLALWDTKRQMWANPFTSMDGEPVTEPPATISWKSMVPMLLEADPDALFVLRFTVFPDENWRKANLSQYTTIRTHNGGVMRDGKSLVPSWASDKVLQLARQNIRDVVAWTEKQPWRNRVVGYTVFVFGEGGTDAALFDEVFDDSEPMQEKFRQFVHDKYETDEALQAAWGDEQITLEAVRVPTRKQWLEKKDALKIKHWPDPAKVQRERDYFELQKQLFHRYWGAVFDELHEATQARPAITGADTAKQHMLGWIHNKSFEADWYPGIMTHYANIMLASGSISSASLLDHPGLEMIQTPGMYYNRAMGYAWEAEGLTDSLTLRDKAHWGEADMRTWINRDIRSNPLPEGRPINDAGMFMNPTEMKAGFDRTLAWALTRNQMYYYAAVYGGNWWYDDPTIAEVMTKQNELISTVGVGPWELTRDVICIVVDDESPMYEDFSAGFQHLALERQLEEGLALAGVPYRIHLLSDLKLDNFPAYRCYLFPNLFKVDEEVEALLREKVLRDGNVAIFGPGTGLTDGTTLTAEPASRLLGVPMELVDQTVGRRVILQDHGHQISDRLPTLTYGDSHAFGPLLVPSVQRFDNVEGAIMLGAGFYYYFFDRPGLFVRDFGKGGSGSPAEGARGEGDYSVIFTPAVPVPPEILREAARYAGAHVWTDDNAVIYASGNLLGIHSVQSGSMTVHIPEGRSVRDLHSGEAVPVVDGAIELNIDAPATRLFALEPTE